MYPIDWNNDTEINNLVDEYKRTGDNKLRDKLIENFKPYFLKYVNLLCTRSNIDLNKRDTVKFLRLFAKQEVQETPEAFVTTARKTVTYLRSIFKDCTKEDVYNDLVCIFLENLYRYKLKIASHTPHKSRISFTHYILLWMRFGVKKLVITKSRDALSLARNCEYVDDMDNIASTNHKYSQTLDLRWIRGETAGDLFGQLDEYERYLLYLKYDEDRDTLRSDYDVARTTGQERMYVRRRLIKLRDKLKELVEKG